MRINQNDVNRVDFLAALACKNSEIRYQSEQAMMIFNHDIPCLFVDCKNIEEAALMMKQALLPEKSLLVLHQKELLSYFDSIEVMMEVYNAAYLKPQIEVVCVPGFTLRQCTLQDCVQASMLYHGEENDEYVQARIQAQAVWGMFDHAVLAGMIGIHEEGSIGLLAVDPRYQRRHLAMALESYLIQHQLRLGKCAFVQVVAGNEASFALQRKLGLTIGTEPILWCQRV